MSGSMGSFAARARAYLQGPTGQRQIAGCHQKLRGGLINCGRCRIKNSAFLGASCQLDHPCGSKHADVCCSISAQCVLPVSGIDEAYESLSSPCCRPSMIPRSLQSSSA